MHPGNIKLCYLFYEIQWVLKIEKMMQHIQICVWMVSSIVHSSENTEIGCHI